MHTGAFLVVSLPWMLTNSQVLKFKYNIDETTGSYLRDLLTVSQQDLDPGASWKERIEVVPPVLKIKSREENLGLTKARKPESKQRGITTRTNGLLRPDLILEFKYCFLLLLMCLSLFLSFPTSEMKVSIL